MKWRRQVGISAAFLVIKALLDSSSLFDISRANLKRNQPWAQNILRHEMAYKEHHQILTISGMTVFELLDGFYRRADQTAVAHFHKNLLPTYEVIRTDPQIEDKAAEINGRLVRAGMRIGIVDAFVAATAISHGLTLVNANTKHFQRVVDLGFPLTLTNWRELASNGG